MNYDHEFNYISYDPIRSMTSSTGSVNSPDYLRYNFFNDIALIYLHS